MRRLAVYSLLAATIGGFFLFLAARELPFSEVLAYFKEGVDVRHLVVWSVIFVAVYSACHAARVLRWYYLVKPIEPDVSARDVHRVCLAGLAAILVLPLRLGEFVRPYLLAKKTDVPMSAALGTAVVERVVDGLTITGLLFITLATYDGEANTTVVRGLGLVSAAVFVPALFVSIVAYWRREWTVTWVRRLLSFVSVKVAETLSGLLDTFIIGFKSLADSHSLSRFLALTVIYWLANVISMWVFAHFAFGFDISMAAAATMLAVLVVGIMIPAGPGMAGNFEYFLLIGAALFVTDPTQLGKLGAMGALMHLLQFVVILLPGVAVLVLDPDSWRLIKEKTLEP